MKRIRWFVAEWPMSLRSLANKMRSNPFKPESLDGFLIDHVRDDSVGGRYIEKVTFEETITNPFGEARVYERLMYRQIEFNLFSKFPHIELWDSPRSTNGYISKLQKFTGFEVTIEQMSVNVIEWADGFESASRAKLKIDSVQIAGLEIEKGITARMVISGESDVREALQRVAKTKRYELEKVHLQLQFGGEQTSILMANSGSVKLDDSYVDDLLPALRRSLPRPK